MSEGIEVALECGRKRPDVSTVERVLDSFEEAMRGTLIEAGLTHLKPSRAHLKCKVKRRLSKGGSWWIMTRWFFIKADADDAEGSEIIDVRLDGAVSTRLT